MRFLKAVGLTLLLGTSAPAVVADELDFTPGFYLVTVAGETMIDYGSGVELGGNGYSIGGGYDINRYLALEAEYNNYFDYTVSSDNYSVSGLSVRGLLRYPLGSWAPFVGYTSASAEDSLTVGGTTYSGAGTLSGVSVGFEVALTEALAFRFISDQLETDTAVEATITKIGIVSRF